MKKSTLFQYFLFLIITTQYGFSQVDVVYNNLVWSDEFDINGAVNANNWFQQTQLPAGGSWFSGELQHYTNRIENSFIDSGLLNIVAKNEVFTDQGVTKNYTSARLNSKFPFKYGRVDVRAKVPIGAATWPAIWMLGKNINEPGAFYSSTFGTTSWPACGEIDIMEHGIFPSQNINYVQGTLHTPSSFGNSFNNGGTIASDLLNSYHIYSMNWSPFQISFLLDNVVYYTYNPSEKNASTWPFDKEQYLLLNLAMGGIAGTIPINFTQAVMQVDYVRVYQNTLIDTQSPTNFTASIGAVTSSTIELLLNGLDNSGTVVYSISYGTTTVSFANPSGVQKSIVLPNLNPTTTYNFTIAATDLAGNAATNNPQILSATTSGSIGCSGMDTVSTEGSSFSAGYNYSFETLGNDVKITFQLLDTNRVGVVAFLRNQSPFSETQMSNVSGSIFTKTITGQTIGSTINYATKFAFAGGLSVTRYVSYVVGNNCNLEVPSQLGLEQFSFNNPANNVLNIVSFKAIDKVEIYSLLGNLVSTTKENTDFIDLKSLSKGLYLLAVYYGEIKLVKKLIIE